MDFQINTKYKFTTHAPAILGATFNSATLIGMMNFQSASREINVVAMQANIGPLLPQGSPQDYKKYTFYEFQFENGSRIILAGAWIDMNTVTVVSNTALAIRINGAGDADISKIRTALVILGYSNITIEQLSA